MSDIEPSVVFRTGPITERDYDEAIKYLQEAIRLGTTGCPCGDSSHSAESCHHNPLLQARRGAAKDHEFRCFHCGQVFSEETAREHFGNDENGQAKCESEVKATLALFAQQVAALVKETTIVLQGYDPALLCSRILSLADPSALAAHDAALAQKLLNSFTEQTAKLEADNAKLREALEQSQLLLARYREKARLLVIQTGGNLGDGEPVQFLVSDYETISARNAALLEVKPPETQGKETT